MKKTLLPLSLLLLAAACGEDRSDEQPFPPSVETLGCTVDGGRARLSGRLVSNRNSLVTELGVQCWNDSLDQSYTADAGTSDYEVVTDTLDAGTYHYAAYAVNGMGKAYGDTLSFDIP